MNKRDLIKALFKDPTIKALYESGHFNATDINRAILLESAPDFQGSNKSPSMSHDGIAVQITTQMLRILNEFEPPIQPAEKDFFEKILNSESATKSLDNIGQLFYQTLIDPLEDFHDQLAKVFKLNKDNSKFKPALAAKLSQILSEEQKNQILDKIRELLSTAKQYSEDEKKEYVSLAKLVLKANALINKPEFVEKQADFLKNLDDKDFLEELVSTYLNVSNNTDQTNTTLELIKKYRADENIKPLQQQIAKLKASLDKIQGKSTTPSEEPSTASVNEYVDGLANEFDEKTTKTALQKLTQWSYESGNSDAKNMSILKAFIAYASQNKGPVSESEQEAQRDLFLDASVEKFIADLKTNGAEEELVNLASKILKDAASNKGFQEIFQDLKDKLNLPSPSSEEESIEKKRQQLLQRASSALAILNVKDSELLKNDTFMIFMGSVLEKEGVIQEVEEQLESYVEKYLPQLESEETREEFYITQEEVGDLKTFLETNKDNVDKIIAAAVKKSKEDGAPEVDDEDVSPPELAEFQEAWTEQLQTFFGKNPKKSSFMRRLLLKDQANMLYTTISVLEKIEAGEQKGAEGEAASLTNMNKAAGKKEDPKPANTETSTDQGGENQGQTNTGQGDTQGGNNSKPEDKKKLAKENTQQQSEKVQLPPKKKRIIKQDLQAMVDLLRDVKKAIGSYKDYSTRNSVDPRFDGSKLKAKLDNLLAQAQEDIFDLHSNLELPAQQSSEEEGNMEEALSGIFMEKADPQRKEKIALVKDVYMEAKRLYIKSLAVSMAPGTGQSWTKAQEEAGNILEILKREDFIALFPTGMSTASGKIMTVTNAYDVMKDLIQKFIEIVRDIVLIAKTDYVTRTNIRRSKMQLKSISEQIADLFRIPSKFSPEELRQAKQEEAEDENNLAITPIAVEKLEDQENDNGANVAQDGPTIEPGGQDPSEFTQIKQEIEQTENISEPEKEELNQEVDESASWINTLEGDKKAAVVAFGEQLIEVRKVNEVEIPQGFDKQIQTDKKKIEAAFDALSENYQAIVQDVMTNEQDDLVKYLQTVLNLQNKVGDSLAKKFLDLLKKGAGKVADAAKAAMKPIKELYKQIKPNIREKLKSLAQAVGTEVAIGGILTAEAAKMFVEMLATFFKDNLKKVTSTGKSKFKEWFEKSENSEELTDEQKQALQDNKEKFIASYDNVSFETQQLMDSLPGKLGGNLAKLLIFLIDKLYPTYQNIKDANLRIVALALFLKFASPQALGDIEEKSIDDLDIDVGRSNDSQAAAGEESNTEDDAEYDEQIQEYVRKLTDPGFTKKVMTDIIGDEEKVKQMGKESIEAVASIIEIAKLIKNSPGELDESISRILNKVKTSAKSMMNKMKAKSHFSEYKAAYGRFFDNEGFEKAKPYIAFLLQFVDGLKLKTFIQYLSTKKGDIKAAQLDMIDLRDSDNRPNPAKEAQPLPPGMSQEDFYDRTPSSETRKESLEKALKPIIETILKEQYNY